MLKRLFPALILTALAALCAPIARAADESAPVKTTLPNGLRIICKPETDTPLVAIDVFVRAGAPQETPANAGIGSFVAHTLFASTPSSTPEIMTREINALGGNVSASWHPDWTQIAALTVKDKFPDAIFLLANSLKNADFDAATVEDARQQILAELDSRDADLFQTAYGNFQKTLYAGTSYGRPEGGTADTVRRLTRADLLRYYTRYYIPQNIVFVVVGNVTAQAAQQQIADALDDFPRTGRPALGFADPLPPLTQDLPPVRVYQPDLDQEIVMAGYRAAPTSSPDYPALLVANALLGGMKSGRLFTQLREKQGLAYDLGSVYNPRLAAGDLAGYVFGAPTKTDPTTKKDIPTVGLIKEGLLAQFAGLQTTPPTPADLSRAKHFLIGSYALRHERIEDRAALLGTAELSAPDGYKLDTDYAKYINAVSAADVQRVAAKYFVHPVISTVEPQAKSAAAQAREVVKAMADGQINLVVIRAADMDRSVQFYRLLGLDFTKHRHGKGVEHYASETGSVAFEIYPRQNEDAGLPSLRIGFQVASVDEAVTALQGAEPSSSPRPKTHPALSYRNGTRERLLINDANEASYLEVNLDEN